MRSPFQSETEAFRSLLLLITALVPIVLAAALGPAWLALAVLGVVVLALGARVAQLRARTLRGLDLPVKMAPAHIGPATERRVLVVANDTLGEDALLGEVSRLVSVPGTRVLVLVPALISAAARLTGAVDAALEQARVRLDWAMGRIGSAHDVKGEISQADPLAAIEDAFATFAPDEVIVSTHWERAAGALEPRLAGLVRERFAVPVRHLVFEPGSEAREPDRDTEARYRREFGAAAVRGFGLRVLAGAGIIAALVISLVALIERSESNRASATAAPAAGQVATSVVAGAGGASGTVIDVQVVAEGKKGPEGQMHDDFSVTEFHVTVGRPITLRIDNTDTVPHSITSVDAGVNIVAQPGTHGYTLLVNKAGRFEWNCMYPCDPWSMTHVGYMRGFITATAS